MRGLSLSLLLLLAGSAGAATITVNTATDDFGSVTSNCSLREAIQSANNNADFGGCTHTGFYGPAFTDNIELPTLAGGSTFTLTRFTGHDDANNSTDLDIAGNVNINGVSATNSVIRGDTNDPDNRRERLIHVLSGTVTLNNLTLRDGLLINQAAGAGLRTEPGSTTTLNNVVVGANTADGNAGGILNRGAMTINASAITNNRVVNAADGGAGLFHSGTALTINDTVVSGNVVENDDDGGKGGAGLHLAADAVIDNCLVENNRIEGGQPGTGGGLMVNAGSVQVVDSTLRSNAAGRAGGLACLTGTTCRIEGSLVSANTGEFFGGGVVSFGALIVRDSMIELNQSAGGSGGISASSGTLLIERSTIRGNRANGDDGDGDGGGLGVFAIATLNNVSVLDNRANGDGGGLNIQAPTQIRNGTIAGNVANADGSGSGGGGSGGGFHVTGGAATLANTVVAGNSDFDLANDCSGDFVSAGFNHVQNQQSCQPFQSNNDVFNVAAGLAPAADNGGRLVGSTLAARVTMLTRAPLANSPLVDAGNSDGCSDASGTPLAIDQLGNPRALDGPDQDDTARCDKGAVEFVIPNTAPSLSTTTSISLEQGTQSSFTAIAAVGDAEQPVDDLIVSTTTLPPGITLAALDNDGGTVRARLSVGCAVSTGNAAIGLQVSDGALDTTGTFTFAVTANQAPAQGNYSNQNLAPATGATVTPTLAPSDAGSVSSVTASASAGYTGTASVAPATGVVTLADVGPAGSHTITVTATDQCGASSQRSFTLTVAGDDVFEDGFENPVVQLAAAGATKAELMLPVALLRRLPDLPAEDALALLSVALADEACSLQLRGNGIERQWRLERESDRSALLDWQSLPPPPIDALRVVFHRAGDGGWRISAID